MSGGNRNNASAFGRLLQHHRLRGTPKQGESISRTRLAEMMKHAFSASAIEKYETGQRRPPPSFIVQAALALELTREEEAALIRAVGADMEAAYLSEYGATAGSLRPAGEVPDEVKRQLSSALMPTHGFQSRLDDPEFIALAATGDAKARNRIAQAQATMLHIALIVQVARYHIHLARYERLRHRSYLVPPNPAGGDVAAAFNFTSFAVHAISVEHHFIMALALQFDVPDPSEKGSRALIATLYRALRLNNLPEYNALLEPFETDRIWQWLRDYRNRWMHSDPVRIRELGMQFSSRRNYWRDDKTAIELTIGTGDPPETNVDELLERGVYCFNLMARQFDAYIGLLEKGRPAPLTIFPG